jgi:hypothetical protein
VTSLPRLRHLLRQAGKLGVLRCDWLFHLRLRAGRMCACTTFHARTTGAPWQRRRSGAELDSCTGERAACQRGGRCGVCRSHERHTQRADSCGPHSRSGGGGGSGRGKSSGSPNEKGLPNHRCCCCCCAALLVFCAGAGMRQVQAGAEPIPRPLKALKRRRRARSTATVATRATQLPPREQHAAWMPAGAGSAMKAAILRFRQFSSPLPGCGDPHP